MWLPRNAGDCLGANPGETQLVEQEQWLRSNGLPLVVPPTRRLRGLVPRTVPLLVTLALLATGLLAGEICGAAFALFLLRRWKRRSGVR